MPGTLASHAGCETTYGVITSNLLTGAGGSGTVASLSAEGEAAQPDGAVVPFGLLVDEENQVRLAYGACAWTTLSGATGRGRAAGRHEYQLPGMLRKRSGLPRRWLSPARLSTSAGSSHLGALLACTALDTHC